MKSEDIKEQLISCLPPGAAEPTAKELKAFAVIITDHPGFRDNPNGIQLLAKLYADNQKSLHNTMYETATRIKKSRNGASQMLRPQGLPALRR